MHFFCSFRAGEFWECFKGSVVNQFSGLERGAHFGKYTILGELGRGSMGIVYLVEDSGLHREVALKVLSDSLSRDFGFRQRFQLEARSVAGLAHPNIVRVHAFESLNGLLAIEMELVDGGSMADIMVSKGLTVGEVARLSHQILDALDCCHQEGLVHRDIKPTNILIDRYGNAKLTDFGLAKILEGHLEMSMRGTGSSVFFMGTPRYAPPEAWDSAEATASWDLYSLGMVMYQAVAGHTPYEAATPMALVKEMATRRVVPLQEIAPQVSPEFAQLVGSMTAHEPGQRPESARAALEMLRKAPEMSHPLDTRAPTIVARRERPNSYIGTFVKRARKLRLRSYHGFLAGILITLFLVAWLVPHVERASTKGATPGVLSTPSAKPVAGETQMGRFWKTMPDADTLPTLAKFDKESARIYDVWRQDADKTYPGALLTLPDSADENVLQGYAAFEGTIWGLRLSPHEDSLSVEGGWASYEGPTGSALRIGGIHGSARWLVPRRSLLLALEFADEQTNATWRESVSATETAPPCTDTRFLLDFEAMPMQQPLLYNELLPRRLDWALALESLFPAIEGARTRVPRVAASDAAVTIDGVPDEPVWDRRFSDQQGTIGVLRGLPGVSRARMILRATETALVICILVPHDATPSDQVSLALCKGFAMPKSETRWWRATYDQNSGVVADCLVAGRVQPWSCTWELASGANAGMWCVEMKIPFASLGDGHPPDGGDDWHLNCVARHIENPAHPVPVAVWGYPVLEQLEHGVILEF